MTAGPLTPARRRGVELLDDPATPADVRDRAMADVARSNVLFGGTRSAVRALRGVLRDVGGGATVLDVGTGLADIPDRARRDARRAGVELRVTGVDVSADILASARQKLDGAVCADATRLPFRDEAFDVVTCSQLLHHFTDADATTLIRELHRVARRWVVISDLRRSWVAAAAFWIAATVLRFHPVTRHDGIVSVLRGFTSRDLAELVATATTRAATIRRGLFWRITAVWRKADAIAARA